MKIAYEDWKPTRASMELVEAANAVIADLVEERGLVLTIRQLYYQLVTKKVIPNKDTAYNRLKGVMKKARMAGLVSWMAIEDRTRKLKRNSHWDSPADIISGAAAGYAIDMWERQPQRVEIWVEKEALSGVFQSICEDLDVPFFACRGYVSASEMWRAARRHRRWMLKYDQPTVILHFGDHDPSGMDMTRNIREAMRGFRSGGTTVERIALNMDQVEQYELPPDPAKTTDSRSTGYIEEFGPVSWELDALDPTVLQELVQEEVMDRRDPDIFGEDVERQAEEKKFLWEVSSEWDQVVNYLERQAQYEDAMLEWTGGEEA